MQPKISDEAVDKMGWFRCINKTAAARRLPSKSSKRIPNKHIHLQIKQIR